MAKECIALTEPAAAQIKEQLPDQQAGVMLRVAVRKVDDGSFDYAMGFDEMEREGDQRFTVHKIPLVVGVESLALVRGMTVDYVELEPGRHEFIFLNPNDPAFVPPKE